jgi:hypothetical protein
MRRAALLIALASVAGVGGGLAKSAGNPETGATAVGSSTALQDDGGPAYNGQFTFVRIRFGDDLRNMGSRGYGRRWGRSRAWAHDWPRAETNFAKILNATTFIDTYMEGASGRVLTLDDPELFKYPVASIIEVGWWNPSDAEILGLRNYLLKGGFLIVDDTRDERGNEQRNFRFHMNRALPGYELLKMPNDHDIFSNFFFIENPLSLVPPYGRYPASYWGIFENNDPEEGRLMVIVNWNQDLQEYWEFSDQGYYPVDLSREAYQFGVNYMIYAYTH